jgi:hypothetical protein
MKSSLTEVEEITLLAKFEDENNSVGFVDYNGSDETDWQKENKNSLKKSNDRTIGWKILNLKTYKIEDISRILDPEQIQNPYKSLDRLAVLYKKYGFESISVNLAYAYSKLVNIFNSLYNSKGYSK